jgi:hypothetical protein
MNWPIAATAGAVLLGVAFIVMFIFHKIEGLIKI